jgi:hypothetical protein
VLNHVKLIKKLISEKICGVNTQHDRLVLLSGAVFETEDRSIRFSASPQRVLVAGFCPHHHNVEKDSRKVFFVRRSQQITSDLAIRQFEENSKSL